MDNGESELVTFRVEGIPPKQGGEKTMWCKPGEIPKIAQLRLAASRAMNGRPPLSEELRMKVTVCAAPSVGDLDNFLNGICDALMAAHPQCRLSHDWALWPEVDPSLAICYLDDRIISDIRAIRIAGEGEPYYTIELGPLPQTT